MNVLLVGGGAREHALAWKLRQSDLIDRLYYWPGNAAMESVATPLLLDRGALLEKLPRAAKLAEIDFVVVGPEGPLAEGLADICHENGLPIFGPSQRATHLESSKSFAKEVMNAAGIPTAPHITASDIEGCRNHGMAMLRQKGSVVLKADGLAGGKGVFVCKNQKDLEDGLGALYGGAFEGRERLVVIEECLKGRECSFFSFIGNGGPTSLGFAVDFKRLKDGDIGPNTGGMGCYAPVPWLPADAPNTVNQSIIAPLMAELAKRDIQYTGCLYVGLMWTEQGPYVIEFNVRLGDPEAQVLAVQDDRDWAKLIAAKLGLLDNFEFEADGGGSQSGCSLGVVLASADYPYPKEGGQEGPGTLEKSLFLSEGDRIHLFAAQLREHDDKSYLAQSGRILTICTRQASFHEARTKIYQRIAEVVGRYKGFQYRRDIGASLVGK